MARPVTQKHYIRSCFRWLSWSAPRAALIDVSIDTTALTGTAVSLAFDLVDGDGITNNTVTITPFATDGSPGSVTTLGGVTGTLPGPVTIDDTGFFNELLQGMTLGTRIDFTLAWSEHFAGGSPDEFSLLLFDNDPLFPQPLFNTTDPTGTGALLTIDLAGMPAVFAGDPADPRPQALWSATPAGVPEPGVVWLSGAGILGWRFGKRRQAR